MRSIAALLVLFFAAPTLLAATITGKVVRVADGDTVTVVIESAWPPSTHLSASNATARHQATPYALSR